MKKILAALLVTVAMTGTAIAEEKKYTVDVSAASTKVSTKSVAKVHVSPAKGYKMNLEYPTKVKLNAADGVTLEKTTLAKGDGKIDVKGVDFEIAYTPDRAGKTTITGEIKFAVCTENDCIPQVEKISINVDAK